MSRALPILLIGVICLSLIPLFALPHHWWGMLVKSLFGLWVLVLLKVAYNKMILPGTLLSALFFSLTWWFAPSWLMFLFGLLMILSIYTTYRTVEIHLGGFKSDPKSLE